MFCVVLNRVEADDIIKNIKTSYSAFNMSRNNFCYIIAVIDPKKDKYRELSFADAFIVDGDELQNLPQERLDEIALDMVELGKDLGIRTLEGKEIPKKLIECKTSMEYHGTNCRFIPSKYDKPDIKNLTADDIAFIYEFFSDERKLRMYSIRDFLFKYEVEDDGSVYYLSESGKEKVADLKEHEFAEIFFDVDWKRQKIRKAIERFKLLDCFTDNSPNIFLFVNNNNEDSVQSEIVTYKANLFNVFKNIYPEDYVYLPKKVVEIMVANGYIPINELKKIVGTSL